MAIYLIKQTRTVSLMGDWGKEKRKITENLGYFDGSLTAVKEHCGNYSNEKDTEISFEELKELK